ncbi:MAG: hypothetical protein IJD48_01940 [Clostridia bacterium]|nr:hypothetical protein [Clostridia bacterium]
MRDIKLHSEKGIKKSYKIDSTSSKIAIANGAKPYEKIVLPKGDVYEEDIVHEYVIACGSILHKVEDMYGCSYTGIVEGLNEEGTNTRYYVKDFVVPKTDETVYTGGIAVLDEDGKVAETYSYFSNIKPEAVVNAVEGTFVSAVEEAQKLTEQIAVETPAEQ